MQAPDRLDDVHQVDHVARVAVVQGAEFLVVGGEVVDDAEVVARQGEVARETRVRDGRAGFDAEFGGGDDEAVGKYPEDQGEVSVRESCGGRMGELYR